MSLHRRGPLLHSPRGAKLSFGVAFVAFVLAALSVSVFAIPLIPAGLALVALGLFLQ